ncbi:Nn.00g102000.m01.CDS01 [Neocucurbitaria sp. VM-36]
MTQPTSVNITFDTSLVDLNPNASFSTTESDPSDFGTSNPTTQTPIPQQPSLFEDQSQETPKQSQTLSPGNMTAPPKPSTPVQHIPTQDAYDQWASVYDSDGNMLQSIDDVELETLLPEFINLVLGNMQEKDVSLLDLGCGTGRNTAKLLSYAWPQDRRISVTGMDFSQGMLDVAEQKLRPLLSPSDQPNTNQKTTLRLECTDCFPTVANPSLSPLPSTTPFLPPFHAVISTLVLEHIPLPPYFATLSSLLHPNAIALVTNMHSDMGYISQAGFINAQGVKVRGSSFAHTLEQTVQEARRAGFEVLGMRERGVSREDVESGKVGRRGEKWIGVNVWFAVWLRKVA